MGKGSERALERSGLAERVKHNGSMQRERGVSGAIEQTCDQEAKMRLSCVGTGSKSKLSRGNMIPIGSSR